MIERIGLALIICLIPASGMMADGASSVKWAETEYNFGTVPEGTQVTHRFEFINESDRPVVITAARPSCGCTVANFSELTAPGATGFVEASFNTEGRRGNAVKSIDVRFGNGEAISLRVTGMVGPRN